MLYLLGAYLVLEVCVVIVTIRVFMWLGHE